MEQTKRALNGKILDFVYLVLKEKHFMGVEWSDKTIEVDKHKRDQPIPRDNVEHAVVSRTKRPYIAKSLEEAKRFKQWFESVYDNAYYEECKIYRLVVEEK